MFDWNDEELTNIIWGEDGEGDDHIVPYPDQVEEKPPDLFKDPNKKEICQDPSNIGHVGDKTPTAKSESRVELDVDSKFDLGDSVTGSGADSWPRGHDPTSSNARNADQDSVGTATIKSLTKSSKNGSSRVETTEFDKNSEMFENPDPPENAEQVDFVDYGWANIGSFDDLDRIFSNNDQIFGDMRVGNSDELWFSSKDVSRSPLEPTPLSGDSSDLTLEAPRISSDRSEIQAQFMLDTGQSFVSGYEKLNEIPPHASQAVQASIDTIEYSGGKTKLFMKQKNFGTGGKFKAQEQLDIATVVARTELPYKGNRQKRLLKSKKLDQNSGSRQLRDLCSTWPASRDPPFQQVNSQYAPAMVNPSAPLMINPPSHLQKHFSGSTISSPFYGNVVNYYPTPSVLAQFHPGEGNHEVVSAGYDDNANYLKKPADACVARPLMTPKEKIEKLRRRQQMRAILAIQKQQQQFVNMAPVVENPTEEGGNIEVDESISGFPPLETNSPIEQDDSRTVRVAFDNCSAEESVLYRLQDTISNLDIRIRLCFRDSLLRLAQSAMQRQYPSDTSSNNTSSRDEILRKKDIDNHERFARMPDVETDTNPIDRAVAHLLFHRPLEYSGKPGERPESPTSSSFPHTLKTSAKGYFPENDRLASPQCSKAPGIFSEEESNICACLETSDNALIKEAADGGIPKIEASK